ncbi:MAG: phage protease, partial [Kangiella sp.]|nr:phage protease [Kangiella sp.]
DVYMAALTNDPAVSGMQELSALAANLYIENQPSEDSNVNEVLLALLTALGLGEDATEEQAVSALQAVQTKADEADDLKTKVAELSSNGDGNQIDLSEYVPLSAYEDLKGEVAQLKTSQNDTAVKEVIDAALTAGKLLPAQQKWAEELGKSDIEQLKSYIKSTPAVAALTGKQTQEVELEGGKTVELTANQLEVCESLGVDPKEYAASLESEVSHGA